MTIETLKRPSQFRRVRGGVRWAGPLFIIEGRRRSEEPTNECAGISGARFGFTITRKVGGAVVRNRIRRRLKEALRTLATPHIRIDHDYVVVASRAAHDYPFAELQDALREAFERLHRQADGGHGRVRRGRGRVGGGREGMPARMEVGPELGESHTSERAERPPPDEDETTPGSEPGRH